MRDVTAFSVGDIIKTTLTVYFSNLPAFLSLSLIVLAPSFLVVLLPDSSSLNDPPIIPDFDADPVAASEAMFPYYLVSAREGLVRWVCEIFLQAVLAYGVVRHLRGGQARFVGSLANFGQRLVPVSVVAVFVAVVISIGFLLLFVPGVWLTVVLWVALPAVAVERGSVSAVARSAELTRGFRVPILGLLLILVAAQLVVGSMAGWIVSAVLTGTLLTWWALQFVVVVMSGIYATAVAVTYHDLRVLKEGADTRAVSSVFSR